jgi:V/A-type H+-transporting ATPase subunit E
MGLENVIEDILQQAKKQVDVINTLADEEVAAINEKAQAKAEKVIKDKQTEVDAQIKRMRIQEISGAHLEVKRAVLNAKKDLLDSVYQSARDSIAAIPTEKNTAMLKAILDKQSSSGSTVYSNARDAALVREMTDLTFAGEIECIGGLAIENEDGSVRMDFTFDTILDDVSEQTLKQISDILFG